MTNLNLFDEESVVTRLDKKLKDLEIKRNSVVLEKVDHPKPVDNLNSKRIGSSKMIEKEVNATTISTYSNMGRQLTSNLKGSQGM